MSLDPTVIALIGTLMGGVGLKLAEHWLGRGRVKIDESAHIRDELRLEITALRAENHQLEDDVDKWRKEYYDLREDVTLLRAHMKVSGLDPPEE